MKLYQITKDSLFPTANIKEGNFYITYTGDVLICTNDTEGSLEMMLNGTTLFNPTAFERSVTIEFLFGNKHLIKLAYTLIKFTLGKKRKEIIEQWLTE